jgi:hypothetical protein
VSTIKITFSAVTMPIAGQATPIVGSSGRHQVHQLKIRCNAFVAETNRLSSDVAALPMRDHRL